MERELCDSRSVSLQPKRTATRRREAVGRDGSVASRGVTAAATERVSDRRSESWTKCRSPWWSDRKCPPPSARPCFGSERWCRSRSWSSRPGSPEPEFRPRGHPDNDFHESPRLCVSRFPGLAHRINQQVTCQRETARSGGVGGGPGRGIGRFCRDEADFAGARMGPQSLDGHEQRRGDGAFRTRSPDRPNRLCSRE
jgi:hypothetical protein